MSCTHEDFTSENKTQCRRRTTMNVIVFGRVFRKQKIEKGCSEEVLICWISVRETPAKRPWRKGTWPSARAERNPRSISDKTRRQRFQLGSPNCLATYRSFLPGLNSNTQRIYERHIRPYPISVPSEELTHDTECLVLFVNCNIASIPRVRCIIWFITSVIASTLKHKK